MARIYRARSSYGTLISGAVAGGLAGLLSLAVLTAVWYFTGEPPVPMVVPNAVGAWFVRWLQTADPDALTHFYLDATVGGYLTAVVGGAALGAAFAGLMDRLPQDHPIAWSLMAALLLSALTWWQALPALDPLLPRVLPASYWLGAVLLYCAVVGAWVHGDRMVRAAGGPGGPWP